MNTLARNQHNPLAVLESLSQEYNRTYSYWQVFLELYTTSADTTELLVRSANGIFGSYQQLLVDYVTLSVAKLLDPPASDKAGTRTNLTIPALAEMLGVSPKYNKIAASINPRIDALKLNVEPLITQRNKRIAHFDRAEYFNPFPLPSITCIEYKNVLSEMGSILNYVSHELNGYECSFVASSSDASAAVSQLLRCLSDADEHRNCPQLVSLSENQCK